MEKTTKKQQRIDALNRHYISLEYLATICGITEPNGKKISLSLLKLEKEAYKITLDYCNGDNGVTSENFDTLTQPIEDKVQAIFNGNLKGFFINGDARGYALKIKDNVYRELYNETGLHKDWGGYGILAPEIN